MYRSGFHRTDFRRLGGARAPIRGRIVAAMCATFIVSFFASSPAWAVTNLRPDWLKGGFCRLPDNTSFLADWTQRRASSFTDDLLDRSTALGLRQDYEDLTRAHDARSKYGLVSVFEERDFGSKLSGFTTSVLNRIRGQQVSNNLNKVRAAAERDPNISKVKRPVGMAVAAAAAYSGEPMDVTVAPKTRLMSRTNVPAGRGQVGLISPYLNGAVDFVAGAPNQRDPFGPLPADPKDREERYRFTLSRGLPLFDLTTGLSYGSTTSMMSAYLTRPIFTPNLTAVVDTSRAMQYARADGTHSEQSFRLLYGFSF